MNRSAAYHNKIAIKLISSKFAPYKANNQIPLKRLIIKAKIKGSEPEASAVALTIVFGQKPAFHKTRQILEGDYTLQHLYLTSRKQSAAHHLDLLSTVVLPFQLENQSIKAKPAANREFSWQVPNCLPPTMLNPVFFPYPVTNNDMNVVLSILPDKSIMAVMFYLNLLRVPINLI